MNGGDDGDDDDGDSSGDDADDGDEDEEEEEEEEHLASTDSAIVIPTVELVSLPEGTESVIPPPSTDTTTTGARITVQLQAAITLPLEAEALIDAVTAALPSPPLPPPLYMPPPVDRRDDIPEAEMLPLKRLCLSTLGSRYEIGESSTARPTGGQGIDYGFVNTLDAEARRRGIGEVRVTKLAELHEHDTQDLYALLEDDQDSRTRILQRVTMDSQRVDLFIEDMTAHQETILIEQVETILGNKGLLSVTTSKGKATCPNNVLNQRGNEMIHDPGITEAQATHTVITHNAAYQAEDLDAYEFDCDEINTAKVTLMANLSHYGLDDLAEAAVQNSNSLTQQDALILSVIEKLNTQVVNYTKINLDNRNVNDTLTAELERYKEHVRILTEGQNVDLKSKDNISDSCA
nr:hypothetical protein [Tanacetum cinerariifolium]